MTDTNRPNNNSALNMNEDKLDDNTLTPRPSSYLKHDMQPGSTGAANPGASMSGLSPYRNISVQDHSFSPPSLRSIMHPSAVDHEGQVSTAQVVSVSTDLFMNKV